MSFDFQYLAVQPRRYQKAWESRGVQSFQAFQPVEEGWLSGCPKMVFVGSRQTLIFNRLQSVIWITLGYLVRSPTSMAPQEGFDADDWWYTYFEPGNVVDKGLWALANLYWFCLIAGVCILCFLSTLSQSISLDEFSERSLPECCAACRASWGWSCHHRLAWPRFAKHVRPLLFSILTRQGQQLTLVRRA